MTVVCYDKPQGAPESGWQVFAGWAPTWTHHTSRGATATISSDAAGPVPVVMVAPETVAAVEVIAQQPEVWPSPDIPAIGYGRLVAFVVPEGFLGNLLVRINNAEAPDWEKFCSLGVLPLEVDVPEQATHHFGPGVHTGNPITLKTGDSVYVAGGALVKRRFLSGDFNGGAHQSSDIRIFGRGVIDTSDGYGPTDVGLGAADIVGVDGLTIEGITYVGRYHWGIATYQCTDVVGDWLRLYSCEIPDAPDYHGQGTPDGWDPVACQGFTLKRSFISASDDSSAIKNDKYGHVGDSTAHLYEDLLLMQGGKSNGVEIGWEGGGQTVSGVTYRRIVLAVCYRDTEPYRTAPLAIHVPARNTVDQVLYEDIDIQFIDGKDYSLFVSTFYSSGVSYSQQGDENRGRIRNVTFRRVHWPIGPPGRIAADLDDPSDREAWIGPVVFEDCTYDGQLMTEAPDGWQIVNADVTFTISEEPPPPDDMEQRVAVLEATVTDMYAALQVAAGHLHTAADGLHAAAGALEGA